MLRASAFHLPFINPSPIFLTTVSIQLPHSLNFASSSYNTKFFSFVPLHPAFPKPLKPISNSAPSPYFGWSLSMVGNSSCKASFSSGSSIGGAEREILVQHLLVGEDKLNLLIELQKKIAEGEDLSDLATEHSTCPSKEQGGMLGWVQKGQMVPEFEEAAFNSPLNKVVRCKTKFGWHLLQVLSEREAASLKDIEPEEFHVKMQDPSFIDEAQLIDVREPEEVSQASLPGFEVLPLRQFGSWSPDVTTKFNPEKDIYVLCHHGVRSLQVAKWLQTQGFKTIFNVKGGIHAYAMKADSSVPTY